MKRVEKDHEAGWIAREKDGSEIGGEGFRWNSRSVARTVVWEADLLEGDVTQAKKLVAAMFVGVRGVEEG